MGERMKIEILTQEEWASPDGIKVPDGSILIGVKDDAGNIIARSGIIAFPHIEGTWVAPSHRKGTLAARMIRALEHVTKRLGRSHLFAFILDEQPEIADYMQRLGYKKQPMTIWAKKVGE